ncbi:MAG: DUF4139 domain-containing protein [Deltaproteobacteria bacterium]|nr:DUF4139 domain-containing protein [Deltaproteobacteria bacterium]
MRTRVAFLAMVLGALGAGCSGAQGRAPFPTAQDALRLDRVVLYRNGIGYFERVGSVAGDVLKLKVRKDQVNDLLKSLTIVHRKTGRALSVSMPLDPQSWANAALATLAPGRGSLAQVLDALRGTVVALGTTEGELEGRIAMVEEISEEPDPAVATQPRFGPVPPPPGKDHKVTLMHLDELRVVRLSRVKTVTLRDTDLAMQFHRSLDATAGEGMFQQVEISIRLTEASAHDVVVSYVVSAPMWKPTYRVVLPKEGKGQALLQGWAVVDNTSGEDWPEIELALTSGAPIAFRYDLHTPRDVERTDLSEQAVRKRAAVAVGETTYEYESEKDDKTKAEEAAGEPEATPMEMGVAGAGPSYAPRGAAVMAPAAPSPRPARGNGGRYGGAERKRVAKSGMAAAELDARVPRPEPAPEQPAIDFESLRRSTLAKARATMVSGLTRFDIEQRVTVPEGTSTMVAIINQPVEGEETFLFRPGGAGQGYESNPYRVVRFRNATPFVLEPGPISIYSGGSFVGEGLSDTVGTNTSATIPFAVEPGIMVSSVVRSDREEMHIVSIVRGVLTVERFNQLATTWTVKAQTLDKGFKVLVRHPKAGGNYELKNRPAEAEEMPDAYLVAVQVPQGRKEGSIELCEETPSKTTISIWDRPATALLEKLLLATNLAPEARRRLEPIVALRQEMGRFDTQIEGLQERQGELDERASETRRNLRAIEKDPKAAALRQRLEKRLEEFTSEADKIGREIVDLQSKRLEKKVELEDQLQDLDLRAPPRERAKAGGKT